MKMLLVASDPMEFTGILEHVADARPAALKLDWARTGRMGSHELLLAANGVGWKRAAAAVDAAREFRPEAIVSTGFCGALDETLGLSDVVVADAVQAPGREYQVMDLDPQGGRRGGICSIDHVATTSGEKRKLRETGACAVEMEAAGVADRAQTLGVPFYCIRAVTDLAGEDLSNDFNRALRSDGHFDTIAILRGALRNPAVRLPELLRLRARCARAARGLGEFFVRCRF
jgi:nucleoside phosphorylase